MRIFFCFYPTTDARVLSTMCGCRAAFDAIQRPMAANVEIPH
jgi:hypothetical protein